MQSTIQSSNKTKAKQNGAEQITNAHLESLVQGKIQRNLK